MSIAKENASHPTNVDTVNVDENAAQLNSTHLGKSDPELMTNQLCQLNSTHVQKGDHEALEDQVETASDLLSNTTENQEPISALDRVVKSVATDPSSELKSHHIIEMNQIVTAVCSRIEDCAPLVCNEDWFPGVLVNPYHYAFICHELACIPWEHMDYKMKSMFMMGEQNTRGLCNEDIVGMIVRSNPTVLLFALMTAFVFIYKKNCQHSLFISIPSYVSLILHLSRLRNKKEQKRAVSENNLSKFC